jgi:hypothetical protein
MSHVQNGLGFEVDLFTFECALTVERCALLLITPFFKIKLVAKWPLQDILECP